MVGQELNLELGHTTLQSLWNQVGMIHKVEVMKYGRLYPTVTPTVPGHSRASGLF